MTSGEYAESLGSGFKPTYVGNNATKEFHRWANPHPECNTYSIKSHTFFFKGSSKSAGRNAVDAGFDPCGRCMKNSKWQSRKNRS